MQVSKITGFFEQKGGEIGIKVKWSARLTDKGMEMKKAPSSEGAFMFL